MLRQVVLMPAMRGEAGIPGMSDIFGFEEDCKVSGNVLLLAG